MSDDWVEDVTDTLGIEVPEDRERNECYFVGGPADGDRQQVPVCRHREMAEVALSMPDRTFAHYRWSIGDQCYRFTGIEYPR